MFESFEYSKNFQKFFMSVTSQIIEKLNNDIVQIQKGLQPDQLSFWYNKIFLKQEIWHLLGCKTKLSKTRCNPSNEI